MQPTLKTMLLAAAVLASGQALSAADLIISDVMIYGHDSAEAIAIEDGRILYIGSQSEAERFEAATTEVLDMAGAMVLPGFVDNHNHLFEAASEAGGFCELSYDGTPEAQLPALKQCRSQSDGTDEWLTGYGFSLENIMAYGDRTPLQVLDSVFPDQPVVLMEQTSHSMWVNSKALALAGIDSTTPEPQGGKILRDEQTGELIGILLDNAGDILMEQAWNSLKNRDRQSYKGLMAGLQEVARNGITTVGDGRMYWKRGWYEVWKAAEASGDLTARVSLRPWIYPGEPMAEQLDYLKSIQSDDTDALLLVNQVKMYSDGIVINGTARVLEPYLQTWIPDEPFGVHYIGPQEMTSWLKALDQLGYGAHIHTIGDDGVRASLNAIEAARSAGSEREYSLTHVELLNSADLPRFRQLEVTADFQAGADYVARGDHDWAVPFLGHDRAARVMRIRPLFDSGANVSLSSDWNVNPLNPLVGIANSLIMAERGLPDIEAAIDAYTINAARSLGLEEQIGTIEVGKSADLVILDRDISRLEPERIPDAQVLMTILAGRIVFDIGE